MNIRRFSVVVLVVALVLTLSISGFAKIKLRVAYNFEPEIFKAFNEAHPDIEAVQEDVAGDNYYEGIIAQVAAGVPPDIVWLDFSGMAQFTERGVIKDLTPFIKADNFDFEGRFDAMGREIMTVNGKIYGIPMHYGAPLGLYYNKDLFDAAGVPYPDDTWTWDTLLEAARKLTIDKDKDGTIGQYGFWAIDWQGYWVPFVWQNEGSILSPDGTRASGYLNSKNTVDAIQWWADFTIKHGVSPKPGQLEGHLFKTGKVAMYVSGCWSQWGFLGIASGQKGLDFNWGVSVLPKGKQRANIIYGAGFGIPVNAAHPEEAWEFLKHVFTPEMDAITARTGIATPAQNVTKQKFADIYDTFVKQLDYSRMVPGARFPWWSLVTRSLDSAFQKIILGQDAQKVLDETAAYLDEEIAEWIEASDL